MNEVKQKAIDHVALAVKNLRRGLALWPDTDNPYMAQGKGQAEEVLKLWEFMLSVITLPPNPSVQTIHLGYTAALGEIETMNILNQGLEERLQLAHDKIEQLKCEEKALEKLKDICLTQCTKGNYDVNNYMRGMANGLILAVSCFTNEEPEFMEAPTEDDKIA